MASLHWKDGRAEIRLRKPNTKKQTTIRLGHTNQREAERILGWVEELITAARHGERNEKAIRWASQRPTQLYDRLAVAGLVPERTPSRAPVTLGEMLDDFFTTLNAKQSTRTRYEQGRERLERYFGRDHRLDGITARDADLWRAWLAEQTKTIGSGQGAEVRRRYSPGTIARDTGLARTFFRKAVRWGMIPNNPFDGVRAGGQRNPDRLFYIEPEDALKLLDVCPDADWPCIIALCRWGGLRCPSEVLRVRWSDIDWGDAERAGRLTVRSPKTEHHEGKAERVVPLFPELKAVLLAAFEIAPDGAERVVERYPESTRNLRPAMLGIVRRAGLSPWPRLFHNLRASRVDDLRRQYPGKVCDAWVGNSAGVSRAHYESVRECDYEQAAAMDGATTNPTTTRPANARHEPTPAMKKPASGGPERAVTGVDGVSNGRNRTRTCDLIHVTDAL